MYTRARYRRIPIHFTKFHGRNQETQRGCDDDTAGRRLSANISIEKHREKYSLLGLRKEFETLAPPRSISTLIAWYFPARPISIDACTSTTNMINLATIYHIDSPYVSKIFDRWKCMHILNMIYGGAWLDNVYFLEKVSQRLGSSEFMKIYSAYEINIHYLMKINYEKNMKHYENPCIKEMRMKWHCKWEWY